MLSSYVAQQLSTKHEIVDEPRKRVISIHLWTYVIRKKYEDTKGVIRSRKSNDQKKKEKHWSIKHLAKILKIEQQQ
jgi:hypothetical protein